MNEKMITTQCYLVNQLNSIRPSKQMFNSQVPILIDLYQVTFYSSFIINDSILANETVW